MEVICQNENRCSSDNLQHLCCLTCEAINRISDILSIVKNSCELALFEMKRLNGEAEPAKQSVLDAVKAVELGRGTLRQFSAIWTIMKEIKQTEGKRYYG